MGRGGEGGGRTFEVELKFRVADPEGLRQRLEALGYAEAAVTDQSDTYLAHPARDFAATGEAFRLRRDGETNALTYKGPKLDSVVKTREELEIPFAPGGVALADMATLWGRLGFRPVAEVRKRRTLMRRSDAPDAPTVALDVVEGLGDYAEIEAMASGEEAAAEAQAQVRWLAGRLGLHVHEPRSYLRMVLEAAKSTGPEGGAVVEGGSTGP
jgi:adenylate cyclase class 2